jgi:hypothetical protein
MSHEKICFGCKLLKPLSEFDKNKAKKDGVQSSCKLCRTGLTKQWYKNNKFAHKARVRKNNLKTKLEVEQFIIEYLLSHPCVDCNENDIVVLEFDHLKDKKNNISSMMRSSLLVIKEEIEKCEVRCANCHRRKTAKSGNHYRYKYIVEE